MVTLKAQVPVEYYKELNRRIWEMHRAFKALYLNSTETRNMSLQFSRILHRYKQMGRSRRLVTSQ